MPDLTSTELKYLVQRQREEIKTINEVGRLLSSTTDPREIIRLVASYLKQAFPLALCGVLVVEPRKLQLIQYAKIAQGDLAAALREICARANEFLSPPLNAAELTPDIDEQRGDSQTPIGFLRSNHSARLTFEGRVIGLLSIFSGKTEAFSKEELHAINIVADQLGAALRNAFLLEELKRANHLKNDLLAVISHELGTPVTAIQEGVSLLLEGALGPTNAEQQDFLSTVSNNVDRLTQLLQKVVATTQILTGNFQCTPAPVGVDELLAEAVEALQPAANEKRVSLNLLPVGRIGSWPLDAAKFKQAISHLLDNAIQATPPEGVVTLSPASASSGLTLTITDTGIGIPAEELPRLFDQFRTVGGINDRKTGGLGLGLFITKAIIDAHGGTIQVKSETGQGTRMILRLPKAGGSGGH